MAEGAQQQSIATWRSWFPVTEQVVHLNHAGVSPISIPVAEAVRAFLEDALRIDAERYRRWESKSEEVRRLCALLIGARPEQIAFVKNTSEGLSLVAAGLAWREGDNIVAVDGEYPSNVYPWWAQRERGVEVRMVPRHNGLVRPEDVEAACDRRTRVVAVSFVDWSTGARNPLRLLAQVAHRYGALFVVDGIQGVGVVPLDVAEEGVDGLAVGGHKWLLAPEGCGWLYLSDRALGEVGSVLHGWKSVTDADRYLPYHFDPRPDALRFEPGSPPHLGIHALGAAVKLLLDVGVETVWERVRVVNDYLVERLTKIGASVLSPWGEDQRSGIVVFRGAAEAAKLVDELNRRGFIVRLRNGGVRAAPHFYTSEEELERFVAAVAALAGTYG